MKRLLTISLLFASMFTYAQQWGGSTSSSNPIYRSGVVVLGDYQINKPLTGASLDVKMKRNAMIRILASGTYNSSYIRLTEDQFGYRGGYLHYNNGSNKFFIGTHHQGVSTDATQDVPAITIRRGQPSVGIGTTEPISGYTLTVDGKAILEEVKVQAVGADFVFDQEYSLPSLSQVEHYVSEHHHLPAVPSAAQMQKEGVFVGEMNMLLLQKIEELTLYLIEQHKDIQQLKEKISDLEAHRDSH